MTNPDRYTYDPEQYDYDENSDTLTDYHSGKQYDGDGNEVDHYFGE